MKKIITTILIYTVGVANIFAQNESDSVQIKNNFFKFNTKEKISYEIRAGVNFSTLSTDLPASDPQKEEYESGKAGFNLGVLANLPFGENIYFQTGVYLAHKDLRLFCIENPFFVSYFRELKPQLKWNVKAGAALSVMFGDSEFDNGQFSLILGTGLYYKRFIFGIQYDMGLTNVYMGDGYFSGAGYITYSNINVAKLRTFSIEIGYRF